MKLKNKQKIVNTLEQIRHATTSAAHQTPEVIQYTKDHSFIFLIVNNAKNQQEHQKSKKIKRNEEII